MILMAERFTFLFQVTDFVNKNRIKKEDILNIVYESQSDHYTLFYWKKEEPWL